MHGRILFPVGFVTAAIVAVFGVLIYTQEPPADLARLGPDGSVVPLPLSAAAMAAFQNIAGMFSTVSEIVPAAATVSDLSALDAMAAGEVPDQDPEVVVPAAPVVRRAGAADATATNPTICAIEGGVRRCRVVN